jgi:hypothetical protein
MTGIVQKWSGTYGYIFQTHARRYFFHINQFDSPRQPIVGEAVQFELRSDLVPPGRLPVAQRVTPVEAPAGVKTLAQQAEGGNR